MNQSHFSLPSCPPKSLFLALGVALLPTLGVAQGFKTSLVKNGLKAPTGIAISPMGEVYFTELPEPGKFSRNNTVSRLDASNNQVVIVPGEPAPTNLAFDAQGNFYWTCSTAGVLMIGTGNTHRSIATGLKNPIGIAVDKSANVFFTQVPDPGMQDKGNNVAQLVGGAAKVLSMGEPEPFDIAAGSDGSLYWTCRSAGVILRRDPMGNIAPLLRGLEKPSGIAIDAMGRLYFSEVPTPGMSGANGGRNRVWEYDPATRNFALITFGEPEPRDVAVTPDGSTVYWTCTTAGVILRGVRSAQPVPSVRTMNMGQLGSTATFDLMAPMSAGKPYRVASSLGLGPIGFDARFVGLAPDAIFFSSFFDQVPALFMNYGGMLDMNGRGMAMLAIPNDMAFKGLIVQTAFFTLDNTAMSGIAEVSTSLRTVFQ